MPTHKPGQIEDRQDGLAFASAMRDCLVCGLAVLDPQGPTLALNGEAEKMLGLPSNPGQALALDLLPVPLPQTIRRLLSDRQPTDSLQVDLTIQKRGPITLNLSLLSLPAQKGVTTLVLALHDLTPLRCMEQKIWRLDRLASIGTLSASMAHEIKNALVAGKTFIDLLLEKHQDSELVDIVRREMARIDSIVSRMLNFVGQARRAFGPVNLHESLEHSLRLVTPQLEDKAIVLTRSFRAAPEMVSGDDHELQQAFVNLFLNALEAMAPHGSLAVATEVIPAGTAANGCPTTSTPQIRVTIKDSGPGIPAKNMEQLFEPFFTTKPAGTGLGLPITQRIIHEHRGAIEVESQVGHGTTFSIAFPTLAA
jgi:signal transduction histidine kinase